jgi:hypothetical protein
MFEKSQANYYYLKLVIIALPFVFANNANVRRLATVITLAAGSGDTLNRQGMEPPPWHSRPV